MIAWDWIVTGFNVRGERLLATKHSSQGSVYAEVQAWAERLERAGDPAARVEVVNLNTGEALKFYTAYEARAWRPTTR